MSLKGQIFLCVLAALCVAILVESALAVRQARQSVENEMHKALEAGDLLVDNALLSLPAKDEDVYLARLVRSFDGNRHIRVALVRDGNSLTVSRIAPSPEVPSWFGALLDIAPETRIDRPANLHDQFLLVTTDPHNEIAETWGQLRDGLFVLLLLDVMVLGLLYGVLRRTTGPLQAIQAGYAALGDGRYDTRIAAGGPEELRALAAAFNIMAARLAGLEAANARLHDQMASVQDEERADIARDLHDDMAPLLFAIRLDAEKIEQVCEGDAAARAHAIGEAVDHLQGQVQAILTHLRPDGFPESELGPAIEKLASFWNRYNRGLGIALDIADARDGFSAELDMAIFRVIQEGLTNVARHGDASQAFVTVKTDGEEISISVADNGKGMEGGEGRGLRGMRERLALLGGSLTIRRRPQGGTQLTATLPRARVTAPA